MTDTTHGNEVRGEEASEASVRRPAGQATERRAERTCAACRGEGGTARLIRWVRGPSGEVAPDLGRSFGRAAGASGRGAWLHAEARCLGKLTSALSRSFRAPVTTTPETGLLLLRMAAEKRARDVLGAARRQRRIEVGSDAVEEALERNEAHLVVVACDARAAAETTGVRRAVASGRACAWGNKERLGRICGRSEVGVLAVTEERLATALFEAIALSHLQGPPGLSGEADVLTEVE